MTVSDKFFSCVWNWTEEWGATRRPMGIVKNELKQMQKEYIITKDEELFEKIKYIQGELNGYFVPRSIS